MTLHEVLRAFARHWLALTVTAILAAGAGGLFTYFAHDFRAVSRVILQQPQTALPGDVGLLTTQKLHLQALDHAQVLTSRDVIGQAARVARVPGDAVTVETAVEQNTGLIEITTAAADEATALSVARELNRALSRDVSRGSLGDAPVTLRVVAAPYIEPSGTTPLLASGIGLVLGLAVAATAVLLTETA